MTAKQLIEELGKMPPDARVFHRWDGEARSEIEHVWLARSGFVITADFDEVCYSDETRPDSAPTERQDPYWKSPKAPRPDDRLD